MRLAASYLFAAAGLALASPADARTVLLKTQAGSPVHWSSPIITVGLDTATPSRHLANEDVVAATRAATLAWNRVQAGQPRFRFVPEGVPDVIVGFCRGRWRGETIDLGHSRFSASSADGTVTSAVVTLNECDHVFTTSGSARDGFDLQAVVTHELGHVLGLGHSDKWGALMYPNGGGAFARRPTEDDTTTLALIYLGRLRDRSTALAQTGDDQVTAAAPVPVPVERTMTRSAQPRSPSTAGLPPDSVSLLSLTDRGGRPVMVYTCEPTLLPPIANAPTPEPPERSGNRRNRRPR
jgi:hypothetical protein